MQALVEKWELKKFTELYPTSLDCPPFVFIEVQPVLTEEAAKRLIAALKRKEARKAGKTKAKKR